MMCLLLSNQTSGEWIQRGPLSRSQHSMHQDWKPRQLMIHTAINYAWRQRYMPQLVGSGHLVKTQRLLVVWASVVWASVVRLVISGDRGHGCCVCKLVCSVVCAPGQAPTDRHHAGQLQEFSLNPSDQPKTSQDRSSTMSYEGGVVERHDGGAACAQETRQEGTYTQLSYLRPIPLVHASITGLIQQEPNAHA